MWSETEFLKRENRHFTLTFEMGRSCHRLSISSLTKLASGLNVQSLRSLRANVCYATNARAASLDHLTPLGALSRMAAMGANPVKHRPSGRQRRADSGAPPAWAWRVP